MSQRFLTFCIFYYKSYIYVEVGSVPVRKLGIVAERDHRLVTQSSPDASSFEWGL